MTITTLCGGLSLPLVIKKHTHTCVTPWFYIFYYLKTRDGTFKLDLGKFR